MSWQTVYFHYDEDALTVFANAGLLRRAKKDVDNEKFLSLTPIQGSLVAMGKMLFYTKQGSNKPVAIALHQVVANIF